MQDRSQQLDIVYFGDTHGAVVKDKLSGIGGFSRLAAVVQQYRKEHPNTLVLFGGDLLGASLHSQLFKGKVDVELLKHIGIQAFALGNHDFHRGPQGLLDIIEEMGDSIPFLAANIDVSQDEHLNKQIKSHHIFDVNGQKIAVVGVLTEETKNLKSEQLGNVVFHVDVTRSVQTAIKAAKSEGADLVLVLSHLGYAADKALAVNCLLTEDEDVIILGNHTHTVLGKNMPRMYFGASQGDYPTIVDDGKHKAYITAAGHHGMALGTLSVKYSKQDNKTHITECNGEPIVIHPDLPIDAEAEAIVVAYTAKIGPEFSKVVAKTLTDLIGLECFPYAKGDELSLEDIIRHEETPLTNFVADIVHAQAMEYAKEKELPPVDFSLIHAGGIRGDLPKGDITRADISTVLQFDHKLVLVQMTGSDVKKALEQCVYKEGIKGDGYKRRSEFLIGSAQVSYQYDISQPRDARVSEVKVNGQAINDEQSYCVAINSHMLGMKVAEDLPTVFSQLSAEKVTVLEKLDRDAVLDFCEQHQPVITGKLDGRIEANRTLLAPYLSSDVAREDRYIVGMKTRKREIKSLASAATLSIFASKEEVQPTDSPAPAPTPAFQSTPRSGLG